MMNSYTAQIWDHEVKLAEIPGLSIDAAREICRSVLTNEVGRVMSEQTDYTEVYDRRGVRRGPFAQTTHVHN